MSRSTEQLIRDLATDLPAVKPLASLRRVTLWAIGLSLPFYLYWLSISGLRYQLKQGALPDPMFVLAASVLVLLAVGGLGFGLASAIPGSDREAGRGRSLFGAGIGFGFGLFLWQWFTGATPLMDGVRSSVGCIQGAAVLALPAAAVVVAYIVRGAAHSLPVATAVGGTGGMALAAVIVHLTCSHPDPLHMMLGHALAPLIGGIALFAVLAVAVGLGVGSRPRSAA